MQSKNLLPLFEKNISYVRNDSRSEANRSEAKKLTYMAAGGSTNWGADLYTE